MIITSWNIRGLNSKGKKRYLAERIKKEKAQIMMLQETKIMGEKMEEILKKIKPTYECMTLDAKGSAGGTAILWNPAEVIVDNWIRTKRILSWRFRMIGQREWFLVSAVYGPHILVEREAFLTQLQRLGNLQIEKMWVIAGDFNMITSAEEKKGILQWEDADMERLRESQATLKMIDINTINGKYTWNNKRGGNRQIASILDRFLATEHFLGKDIFYEATIPPCQGSDHWQIKLEIAMNNQNQHKPFRFEAFWLRDPTLIKKMENWWQNSEEEIKGKNEMHTLQLR